MNLKLITPPTALPLSIIDARQHLKQDLTDDDNLINFYLGAAVEFAQAKTRRQFVAARYQLILDGFPAPNLMLATFGKTITKYDYVIQLERTPLIQVVSIDYTAPNGTVATLLSSEYQVDTSFDPPRISPAFGKQWPSAQAQMGSVRVTFDAGYMAPISANVTSNAITISGWKTLAVGDIIRLSNSGGALPAPLAQKTDYYIQSVISAGIYTLATTAGGAVIDITTAGTGTTYMGQAGINNTAGELPDGIKAWMLLRCESLYTNRGETANAKGTISPLPYVDSLLDPYKTVLF